MENDTESPAKKSITFWLTVIGTLAGVIPLVVLWLDKKEAGVTCTVISADQLVPSTSVPKLSAEYQYNGKPVTNLWRAVLRVRNTGGKTLITTPGANKNVLAEGITLTFPSAHLYDYELTENQPQASGDITGGRSMLKLNFTQWRQQEALKVSLYLSRDSNTNFTVTLNDREIVDGVVSVGKEVVPRQRYGPLLSRVPPSAAAGIFIAGFEGSIVTLFLLGFGLLKVSRDSYRFYRWWRDNGESWRQHVRRHNAREFLDSPHEAPPSVLADYKGAPPPPAFRLIRVFFQRRFTWIDRLWFVGVGAILICVLVFLADGVLVITKNFGQ